MAKKAPKFKAGDYDTDLLNFLGEDILKECVKESDLAIEASQRLSGEVRSKALATVGVLATFIVALFVATYEVKNAGMAFHVCCLCLMAAFGYGVYHLFWGVIYDKENQNGGNTLSNLLNQETLDGLVLAKNEAERTQMFLFYGLGQKEYVCEQIDEETTRMQTCYKNTMTVVSIATIGILIVYATVSWLCLA